MCSSLSHSVSCGRYSKQYLTQKTAKVITVRPHISDFLKLNYLHVNTMRIPWSWFPVLFPPALMPDTSDVNTPQPIDPIIHRNMFTYAHLIDISYCIDKFHKIDDPFDCALDCSKRFPNMTLVHQWYFDDAVCGYIATTYSDIFNYEEPSISLKRKKTIVVSLRGTRSLNDVLADIRVDMVPYHNLHKHLPYCGEKCKIHEGFAAYYENTLQAIHKKLKTELSSASNEDYELVIVGHSMGGSVALLLALHFLDLGFDKLSLVTMGQPLVGNSDFTTWADYVLGSYLPVNHGSYDRKFLRVIHKGDLVTQVPSTSSNFLDEFTQFQNQIYVNVTGSETHPSNSEVVNCFSGTNPHCIADDFGRPNIGSIIFRNYYEAHNTYFRKIGLCGLRMHDHLPFGII